MFDTIRYVIYASYFLGLALLYSRYEFYQSEYNKASGLSYRKVVKNMEYYGKYLAYRKFKMYAKYGFALVDVYIPKANDIYSEIDIIFLSRKGVISVVVKNQSGFIIGDEVNYTFVQMSETHTKHEFHNPIWKNRSHISTVQDTINIKNPRLYHSLVVFGPITNNISVNVTSNNLDVIMIKDIKKYLKKYNKLDDLLTKEQVDDAYETLYKYCRAS